jgi:hypothetical protein
METCERGRANVAENEQERLRHVVESQKKALAEWRRMADEDAGRLKRYHAALFEIAHAPEPTNICDLKERAQRELEATVIRP